MKIARKCKKIAILRIQVLSVSGIVRNILSELLITQLIVLMAGAIGISTYGTAVYGITGIADVLKIYILSFILSSLIYSLTSIIVLYSTVMLGKMLPMLKGKKPYKVVITFHVLL